ncbi:MAG: alpha/beta fold hydrolase [candidate division Zixibacteria bacterium]|nr:alpha/beta fold hydrolase [candidate division Zixibacteria bacterium]
MLGIITAFWMMINLMVHPPDFYSTVPDDLSINGAGLSVRSGYINVDGGKLFYEEAGQGEAFVFIHDGMVHCETWNEQFPYFAEHFRVIRYDRRGYGRSEPPSASYSNIEDLHQLFEQLGISSAHLMGCSAGSRLAIDFTLAYPERVKSLVLVGPVVSGYGFTEHLYTRGGHFKQVDLSDADAAIKYFTEEDPYETAPGSTSVRECLRELLNKNRQNFNSQNNAFLKETVPSAKGRLAEIKVPVLVLVGEYDLQDVHAHSGIISGGVTESRRMVINNAGHLAHMEQPQIFNRLVRQFLMNDDFVTVVRRNGAQKAVDLYREISREEPGMIPFSELTVNILGYEYLQAGQTKEALLLFKLNTEAYPESYNVYDSYAEALLQHGDTARSIENYEKSLQLNPNNNNASTVLKSLGRNN